MQNYKYSNRIFQQILILTIFVFGVLISVMIGSTYSHPKILALIAAIPVIILMIIKPWLGISIFFLMLPVENLYVFHGGLTATMTKLFGVFLVFLVMISGNLRYLYEVFKNKKVLWILFFGGVAMTSILLSDGIQHNINALITLWLSIILYFVLIVMIRDLRTLNLATLAFIVGGVISILSPLVLKYGSMSGDTRYGGLWGDQNEFATVLLILIPLSLFLILTSKQGILKIILTLGTIIIFIGFFLTYSRGGYIAFGVMMILALFKFIGGRNRLKILALSVPSLILALTIFYYTFADKFMSRMETLSVLQSQESVRTEGSLSQRYFYYFDLAPKIFVEHPFFGVGFREFIFNNPYKQIAHNTYLEVLTGMGVIGFIPFIIILFLTWSELRKVEKTVVRGENGAYLSAYANALELGFIPYLVAAFFISLDVSKITWLIITLSTVVLNISRINSSIINQESRTTKIMHP